MLVLSFVSTKGGVGKTTLAAYLSAILADMGLRVLMVDADIRPMLTHFYAATLADDGVFNILMRSMVTQTAISHTNIPNLHLIKSDVATTDVIGWMQGRMDRDVRMRNALRTPYVAENYDIVIIDSQGAPGVMQEAAALAADQIISPMIPDIVTIREWRDGTLELYARLQQARVAPGPLKGVINCMDRTRNAGSIVAALRQEQQALGFSPQVSILDIAIPRATAYNTAATQRTPVHIHDLSRRDGSVGANEIMHRFVWSLLPSLSGVYASHHWDEPDTDDKVHILKTEGIAGVVYV